MTDITAASLAPELRAEVERALPCEGHGSCDDNETGLCPADYRARICRILARREAHHAEVRMADEARIRELRKQRDELAGRVRELEERSGAAVAKADERGYVRALRQAAHRFDELAKCWKGVDPGRHAAYSWAATDCRRLADAMEGR